MTVLTENKTGKLRNLKDGLWAVVKVEIFFKAATLFIVNPLLEWIFNKGVLGNELVFNADMFLQMLSPLRMILFAALFLAAALWCFYEINTIFHVVYWWRKAKKFTILDVLKGALPGMRGMRHISVVPASLYYVLLLPLVHVGYVNTLVPKVTIPRFILGEMQRTGLGRLGIVCIRAGYLAVFAALLLVPAVMALKRMNFTKAVRQNFIWYRMMAWKDRLKIWGAFLVWLVLDDQLMIHLQREIMQNQDFNVAIFKYLIRSASFRSGVAEWLMFQFLQCVGMLLVFGLLLRILDRYQALPELHLTEADAKPLKHAVKTAVVTGGRLTAMGKKFWNSRKHKRLWIAFAGVLVFVVVSEYFNSPPLMHQPWVIGHRGCIYEGENTVAAVKRAADLGADYAEIDVQLSGDGVPVVIHDSSLGRLAGESANVGDLTVGELQNLTVVSNGKQDVIPTYEEVIQAAAESGKKMGLLVELKPSGENWEELAKKVIHLTEEYNFGGQAIFMSLDYASTALVQKAHPEWWVGYCIYGSAGKINASVWDYDVDFLAVEENRISNRFLDQARNQGLPVYVWTVDDEADMRNYLQMGVSGIITDIPDEAAVVRKEFKEKNSGYYIYEEEGYPVFAD